MKEWVTSRLCAEFNRRENKIIQGKIHSVFHHVMNIEFCMYHGDRRIVTLHTPEIPSLPDSVVMSQVCYNRIVDLAEHPSIKVIKKNHRLLFGNTGLELMLQQDEKWSEPQQTKVNTFDFSKISEFFIEYRKLMNSRKIEDGFKNMGRAQAEAFTQFVDGFLKNEEGQIFKFYRQIVGAGIGLTPTWDDAMVGAMSILFFLYQNLESLPCISDRFRFQTASGAKSLFKAPMSGAGRPVHAIDRNTGMEQYFKNTSRIKNDLIQHKKTTDISSKYLKSACEGYFSEPLLFLSQWIMGKRKGKPGDYFAVFTSIGHSSGLDMLMGIREVVCVLQKSRSEPGVYQDMASKQVQSV